MPRRRSSPGGGRAPALSYRHLRARWLPGEGIGLAVAPGARARAAALVPIALACVLSHPSDATAQSWADPPGGWLYAYEADAGEDAGGSGGFTALDDTWNHDSGADEWDGSAIGAGRPGGASIVDGSVLRVQDTGDPRDYGHADPGSNRKLYFGHDLGADGAPDDLLDSGVTLYVRARVPTDGLLDALHPDGGAGIVPYPLGGDGYGVHDGGKGNLTVRQANGGTISFSLGVDGDPATQLLTNNLNGGTASADVDTGEAGTPNGLSIDTTQWHEYWITIAAGGTGTHRTSVWLDGSPIPAATFDVTAGNGFDFATTYVALGCGSTPSSGALDVDYVRVALGQFAPQPATTTSTTTMSTTTSTTTTLPAACDASRCDDGDACTEDACDPARGCVRTSVVGAGSVTCTTANVRSLAGAVVCAPRCRCRYARRLAGIEQDASRAAGPTKRKCRRALRRAHAKARKLRRTVTRQVKRGCLTPREGGARLQAEVTALAARIRTLATGAFCARP